MPRTSGRGQFPPSPSPFPAVAPLYPPVSSSSSLSHPALDVRALSSSSPPSRVGGPARAAYTPTSSVWRQRLTWPQPRPSLSSSVESQLTRPLPPAVRSQAAQATSATVGAGPARVGQQQRRRPAEEEAGRPSASRRSRAASWPVEGGSGRSPSLLLLLFLLPPASPLSSTLPRPSSAPPYFRPIKEGRDADPPRFARPLRATQQPVPPGRRRRDGPAPAARRGGRARPVRLRAPPWGQHGPSFDRRRLRPLPPSPSCRPTLDDDDDDDTRPAQSTDPPPSPHLSHSRTRDDVSQAAQVTSSPVQASTRRMQTARSGRWSTRRRRRRPRPVTWAVRLVLPSLPLSLLSLPPLLFPPPPPTPFLARLLLPPSRRHQAGSLSPSSR